MDTDELPVVGVGIAEVLQDINVSHGGTMNDLGNRIQAQERDRLG